MTLGYIGATGSSWQIRSRNLVVMRRLSDEPKDVIDRNPACGDQAPDHRGQGQSGEHAEFDFKGGGAAHRGMVYCPPNPRQINLGCLSTNGTSRVCPKSVAAFGILHAVDCFAQCIGRPLESPNLISI